QPGSLHLVEECRQSLVFFAQPSGLLGPGGGPAQPVVKGTDLLEVTAGVVVIVAALTFNQSFGMILVDLQRSLWPGLRGHLRHLEPEPIAFIGGRAIALESLQGLVNLAFLEVDLNHQSRLMLGREELHEPGPERTPALRLLGDGPDHLVLGELWPLAE